MIDILMKYIHILAFMVVFTVIFMEMILIKATSSSRDVLLVKRYQKILWGFLLLTLLSGLFKLVTMGEHASIYMKNGVFHVKFTLFLIIALLTLLPYRFFRKLTLQGEADDKIAIPRSVRLVLHIQMLLLVLLPLLGVMMVRGIGYFG